MYGYLTGQYHLQTQFAVLIVRTMHQTSIHTVQKKKKQLRSWKLTATYDSYNSLLYNCPRQLLAHFSGP